MEETPPAPAGPPDPKTRPRMSLPARLLNVFAVPGEVFGDLKNARPAVSNWLVPALLGAVIGVISVFIILSQPAIQKQFKERQTKLIEEGASAGKMTDQERRLAEKFTGPAVLKAVAGAGAVIGSFVSVFWWGFILWFLARRWLKTPVPFAKALEVAGLAMMINVLGGIVAMLLIVNLGRMGATPSLALMVKDFDTTRKGHLFAAAANVFSFWVVGVRSIGLARLAEVSYLRAAWVVVTFWVLEQCFFVITGLGQLAM
jgi:Yip1 domain